MEGNKLFTFNIGLHINLSTTISLATNINQGLFSIAMETKRPIYLFLFFTLLFNSLPAQIGTVQITFEDKLLSAQERNAIFALKNEMKLFFTNTIWSEEYNDLKIPLFVQFVFEGAVSKGSSKVFLAQVLISNGSDIRFFDKGVQFIYNEGGSLYYDPVLFDPLTSFLAFYANLIVANVIDTYEPMGGSGIYEISNSVAIKGNASIYSRGWDERLNLANKMSSNFGLRKARYAYYYGEELFRFKQMDEALKQFKTMIDGLNEVVDRTPRDSHMLFFLKAHAQRISYVLGIFGQTKMLEDLIYIDPDNEKIYEDGLKLISR